MAEQEQNRSEQATPYKIKEAKKKGSVARSLEFSSLSIIAVLLAVVSLWGGQMSVRQLRISQRLLTDAQHLNFEVSSLISWINAMLIETLYILVPLLLALMIMTVATSLIQTGPIWTFFPLKPDFDRINPLSGFKRIFTFKLLFEIFKSVIKLALYGTVAYFAIKDLAPSLMQMMYLGREQYGHAVLVQLGAVLFKLTCAMAFITVLDFLYTRRNYASQLKMSRREVKEEVKRRDGDPRVRARIRELQRETLKRSKSLSRVKEADVLIANPTHLAVAIRYDRTSMLAPQVSAKGTGELAVAMKNVARRHGVCILENRKLARALFRQVSFDGPVPESLYPDVARILVWVYALRDRSIPKGAVA